MSADISCSTIASSAGRRRMARRMPLTILIAGSPGTGKTALSDSFAGIRLADRVRRNKNAVVYSAGKSTELKITHHPIDGPNEELDYSLLEVHNFGNSTDSHEDIERLTQYLEDRFDEMVAEQSRIRRNPRFVDKRVHACIYLVDSFHGLKEFDQVAMTRLSTLTSVIPVIGRAESFTTGELDHLRGRLLADFSAYKIPTFNFQDSDKDQPLRVVRTNEYDAEGNAMLSLKLPFGRVDATDPEVSDFLTLRNYLLDIYAFELIDQVVDILYEQFRTIRLSDPNGRYSVLEPEMLANHASRLKQEQLERESRELKDQEERVQLELEQRRRDLQERERELKQLEEQLALERAVLNRRNRRLSDIDENRAVTSPLQQQKEFSVPPSNPPPRPPAAVPAAANGSALSIGSTGSSDSNATVVPSKAASRPAEPIGAAAPESAPAPELRHSRSVHISPVHHHVEERQERPVSTNSELSSEYTDFDDIRAKSRSPAPVVPGPEVPALPAAPVITERKASVGGSAKTGPVVWPSGASGAGAGSSAPQSAPPSIPQSAAPSIPPAPSSAPSSAPPSIPPAPSSAPPSAPPSAPTQRLKPSVMPPPSPPLAAQKSFIAHPSSKENDIYGARMHYEESLSHASLVTAPDLNPSSSTVDSMPGSFPGLKGVMRKTSTSSMNHRASLIESVNSSGYDTPPLAGMQGYGRPGNTSGSSLDVPDSPSYPPRSPNRPNSFIALDQSLVAPRKKDERSAGAK